MAKILLIGNAREYPLVKGSTTQKMAVCLDTDPGGSINVTVSSRNSKFTLSSGTLLFNSSNFGTPQEVTLTAVNDAVNNSIIDYIDATATGYTSASKRITVSFDTVHHLYYRNLKWLKNLIHIEDSGDVTAMRQSLIDTIFNGNGLPSGDTPDSITTSYTGTMHGMNTSSLVGADSVTQLVWSWQDSNADTWTHYVYHIFADSTPSSKILFVCGGHADAQEVLIINAALADGYDVIFNSQPVCGENTTDSSVVTLTGSAGHEQILNLDTGPDANSWTYNPFELYLFDSFLTHNYLDTNFSYTIRDSVGISGGHIQNFYVAAMDTRVRRSINNRCFIVRNFRRSGTIGYTELDYEGMGTFDTYPKAGVRRWTYHSTRTHFDLLILAASGGRKVMYAGHYDDTAVGANPSPDLWATYLETAMPTLTDGEFVYYMNADPDDKTHNYQAADVTAFINFLN